MFIRCRQPYYQKLKCNYQWARWFIRTPTAFSFFFFFFFFSFKINDFDVVVDVLRILGQISVSLVAVEIRSYRSCRPVNQELGSGTRREKPGMTTDSDHNVKPFRTRAVTTSYYGREMDWCFWHDHDHTLRLYSS